MFYALTSCKALYGVSYATAVLAGVLTLFASLIEFVRSLVRPIGVLNALACGQAAHRACLSATVFTVIIWHILVSFYFIFCLPKSRAWVYITENMCLYQA